MMFSKISLLCPGLLGGSFVLAAQRAGLASEIGVWVRRPESAEEVRRHLPGAGVTPDLAAAVAGAELVVMASPVGAMAGLAERMRPHLADGVIVTDVGSVKAAVAREVAPILHGKHIFVGSHPMAGAETAGVAHAKASLFDRAACIVTPGPGEGESAAADVLEKIWAALGCRVLRMTPEEHDAAVARVSHMPHLLAAVLARTAGDEPGSLRVAGPGFRDCTRVALGGAVMWDEILASNREELLHALDDFGVRLGEARAALESGVSLRDYLEEARGIRSSVR